MSIDRGPRLLFSDGDLDPCDATLAGRARLWRWPTLCYAPAMSGELLRTLAIVGAVAAGAHFPADVAAQAEASAEAKAAMRADPNWAPPTTAVGAPGSTGHLDDGRHARHPAAAPAGVRHAAAPNRRGVRRARQPARGARQTQDRARRRHVPQRGRHAHVRLHVDGHRPAGRPHPAGATGGARAAHRLPGTFGLGPFNNMQDFSLYDRCITRGVVGSFGPAVYGNGARIVQTPDTVVISYEMVHDTRIIPLDGRPPLSADIRQYMGDSRARFEGNTLVIESANFTDKTALGRRAAQRAVQADRAVHAHRPGDDRLRSPRRGSVDVGAAVDDADDDHAAARITRSTSTRATRGTSPCGTSLSGERAYERRPPKPRPRVWRSPERVFERVNGPDRAR